MTIGMIIDLFTQTIQLQCIEMLSNSSRCIIPLWSMNMIKRISQLITKSLSNQRVRVLFAAAEDGGQTMDHYT